MNRGRGRRGGDAASLRREVEAGKRRPFYLLHGEEEFGRERAAAWLIEVLTPDQAADFNVDRFSGDGLTPLDLLEAYQAFPLMATHRLVVLRHCDRLSVEQCRVLERAVDSPAETSLLVVAGDKLDLRRRLFQQLAAKGLAVEFRPPYERQIPEWIMQYGRSRQLTVEREAADLLRLAIGPNLRELAGEVEKLATMVGPGKPITSQAVEAAAGRARSAGIFALADAVGQGDGRRSLGVLHELLQEGDDPQRVLAMLVRHFHLLIKARRLLASGRSSREVAARELGVAPYFADSYLNQARASSDRRLWDGLGCLLQADSSLKSLGRRQEGATMDVLVAGLTGIGGEPA